ncbi:MAG TPA: serine hydrolase [Nitrospiraceae bacterium]|nr:serine hydrolase [Nitrospiraceae bacterium]
MGNSITSVMHSAVEDRIFPGAVLLVQLRGQPVYQGAFGRAALMPQPQPATLDTLYDLASLTKPLATTTAIVCLIQDGMVHLDDALEIYFQELQGTEIGAATVHRLLHHSSGLPGWRPLYEDIASRERQHPGFLGSDAAKKFAMAYIAREPLVYPPGAKSLYSDLGFILLGLLIERVTGRSLARFCREHIYQRLGIQHLLFVPCAVDQGRPDGDSLIPGPIAPTEHDPWRRRLLCGEVHDENAYALGGIAGHAGLFGTAAAVMALAGAWLDGYWDRSSFFHGDLVRRFIARDSNTPASSWGLGWDTPSPPSSSGQHLSPHSFGHLGFTGTSLWIDPESELTVVLLSNRVHPTRQNTSIQQFRPLIHNVVYETVVGNAESAGK